MKRSALLRGIFTFIMGAVAGALGFWSGGWSGFAAVLMGEVAVLYSFSRA